MWAGKADAESSVWGSDGYERKEELAEVVEVHIYSLPHASPLSSYSDTDLSHTILELEKTRERIMKRLTPFCASYLWHCEDLSLAVWAREEERLWCSKKIYQHLKDAPPHLYARVRVGDCVEDEWYLVLLLKLLTAADFSLAASITDSDGEFLLIEAAYELPRWLASPKYTVNRVFLHGGHLCLLPHALGLSSPAQIGAEKLYRTAEAPTMAEAMDMIERHHKDVRASDAIQLAAFARLVQWEERQREQAVEMEAGTRTTYELQLLHQAWAYVPARVASILEQCSDLLPAAIASLAFADPAAIKACRKVCLSFPDRERDNGRRPPATATHRYEWVAVRLTRLLYAKLLFQQVVTPHALQWEELKMKRMAETERGRGLELGARLTCAFEMLHWEAGEKAGRRRLPGVWERMGEAAGKERKASDRQEPGACDDDSWLYVTAEQVDDMLHGAMKGMGEEKGEEKKSEKGREGGDVPEVGDFSQFQAFADDIKSFMAKESGYAGVGGGSESEDEDEEFYDVGGDMGDGEWAGLDPFATLAEMKRQLEEMHARGGEGSGGERAKEEMEMLELMQQMDAEMGGYEKLSGDFVSRKETKVAGEEEEEEEEEEEATVNLEVNLAKNLMSVYEDDSGSAGALTNLLHAASFPKLYELD